MTETRTAPTSSIFASLESAIQNHTATFDVAARGYS